MFIMMAAFLIPSGMAAEYRNSEYGFSITYPDSWEIKNSKKPVIFYAAAPSLTPWILINMEDNASFQDALEAASRSWRADNFMVMPATETTTENGLKVFTTNVTFKTHTGYEAEGFVLGVKRDKIPWIIIHVATVPIASVYDENEFSAIAKSLKFTDGASTRE
jgi:predicted Zn-dependent protease